MHKNNITTIDFQNLKQFNNSNNNNTPSTQSQLGNKDICSIINYAKSIKQPHDKDFFFDKKSPNRWEKEAMDKHGTFQFATQDELDNQINK